MIPGIAMVSNDNDQTSMVAGNDTGQAINLMLILEYTYTLIITIYGPEITMVDH